MTNPTPTRAEVEAQRRAVSFLRSQHAQICFERGDHKDEVDTPWSRGADAIEQCAALRERAEAAEAERAEQWRQRREAEAARDTALAISEASRRAEAAAWNDAIEAAAETMANGDLMEAPDHEPWFINRWRSVRALRRAAPTEGEA